MIGGTTPFIGASESNNGLTAFTSIINKSLDKNVLGVNYNGSVGFAFYHPYKALFSDDVKRVRWKANKHNNRHTLLFLSTAIACQRRKFAYGYKFNTQRMREQKFFCQWSPMVHFIGNISKKAWKKQRLTVFLLTLEL